MNNINKKITIFDFDGVFVDNYDFHKKHFVQYLGTAFSDEEFYELHSGNVYADKVKGVGFELSDAVGYCHAIQEEYLQLPLVAGMDRVVAQLGQNGPMYIVSSGCEFLITAFLERNGIDVKKFTIYGVETDPSKVKKLQKIISETGITTHDMIFVTDTLGDIKEATEVNIASIGVTWGFQTIDTLAEGTPFGFAHESNDIITLWNDYFLV